MLTTLPLSPCADELAADIESALGPAATLAGLLVAAQLLRARTDLVRSRVGFLLEHADSLAELDRHAYRHSNGFTKVKLLVTDRYSVRIHLWGAADGHRGEMNPHGHRWEFASWVVCGEGMTEGMYEPCEPSAPEARAHYLYSFGALDGVRFIEPRRRAWLREREQVVRPAGEVYLCPRDVVHTVAPIGAGFVATVVVQGPAVVESVPVYAPYGHCPRANERPVAIEELQEDLEILDRLLAGLVAPVA